MTFLRSRFKYTFYLDGAPLPTTRRIDFTVM